MNPSNDAIPNGSSTRRIKKSISGKLTSLLSRSSTHINDFSVKLNEPYRQFGPGDVVTGKVILNVAKPLGVTHVVACLYGYVQVFKSHSKPTSTPPRNNPNRTVSGQNQRWVSEYYGDGYASLFEEEVVLCGEGRLDPKLYHFNFAIPFPTDIPLPSSIDFERGTIHYFVWSNITRPSPIMSTTSCETKVLFRDDIDVSHLPLPKPREVTIRAVESNKARNGLRHLTSFDKKRSSRGSTMSKTNQSGPTLGSREEMSASREPSVSGPSSRSSSSSRPPGGSVNFDLRSTQSQNSISPKRDVLDIDNASRSIAVFVQPTRSGCLPGDTVTVSVRVAHTKVVQSLRGVIVTLYRQARVDMHPNLPVVSNGRHRDLQYEDYYPRSKTGLGGLSLTAAGSSQVWRKDLSQTFAPLYVDPQDLSAEVKATVRVPEDVFPSISNVPGEMISFKYFVEVIIDIHGKLSGTERVFQSITQANPQSSYPNTPRIQINEPVDYMGVITGSEMIDTSAIRREKNAVVVQCDLLVGTRNCSEKSRGKTKALPDFTTDDAVTIEQNGQELFRQNENDIQMGPNAYAYNGNYEAGYQNGYYDYQYDENYRYDENGYYYPRGYDDHDYHDSAFYEPGMGFNGHLQHPPNRLIPLPDMPDELLLPEKEQIRRAEERLLPSQPPRIEGPASSGVEYVPSAPIVPEDDDFHVPLDNRQTVIHHIPPSGSFPAPSSGASTLPSATATASATPTIFEHAGLSPSSTTTTVNVTAEKLTEDKQELERRRLQSLGSAPPPEESGANDGEGPSAPPADFSDDARLYGESCSDAPGSSVPRDSEGQYVRESLPRYER